MVSESLQTILDFCISKSELEPIRERVKLYRALANICGSPQLAAKLCHHADELEAADKRCREFAFQVRESRIKGDGKGAK